MFPQGTDGLVWHAPFREGVPRFDPGGSRTEPCGNLPPLIVHLLT